MYQDNMATMRLEINDSLSRSKRTKHIKYRYFLSITRQTLDKLKLNIAPLKSGGQMSSINPREVGLSVWIVATL